MVVRLPSFLGIGRQKHDNYNLITDRESTLSLSLPSSSASGRSSSDSSDTMPPAPTRWVSLPSSLHIPPLRPSTVLLALLPSWLSCHLRFEPKPSHTPVPTSSTAWLDGLRGVAAFIVSIYHYTKDYPGWYNNPYFLGPFTESDGTPMSWTSPLQLPIIRVLYSGQAMVPIFFVISGYVLSFRKVEAIRNQQFEKLSSMVFSSSIRRGFRLYPPVFVTYLLVHTESLWNSDIPGVPTPPSLGAMFSSIIDRAWMALAQTLQIDVYEGQLWQFWTIPIEFTDSIILFALAMAISRMSTTSRIVSVLGIAFFALISGCWGVYLFLFGWVIAECEAVWKHDSPPADADISPIPVSEKTHGKPGKYSLSTFLWTLSLIVGLILAGYPCQNVDHDFFLRNLPSFAPKVYRDRGYYSIWYFWLAVSAPFIVWPIFRMRPLQRLFTTKFTTYLGKISYALYAVHYQTMFMNEQWLRRLSNSAFGAEKDSHLTLHGSVFLEVLIFEILVLWQADLFLRAVDIPTIKFAKWVEKQVRVA